jgi:mono/diheme cytochrome c family protein
MTPPRLLPALLASLCLALAACGGGGDDGGGASGGGGDEGGGATQSAGAQETFSTTCGGCHTLSAAGTEGQVGPNLDELAPDAETVRTAIAQGPGVMPENLLEGAQADEVAQYVAENAGR